MADNGSSSTQAQAGAAAPSIFSGIKVLDFTHAIFGSLCTRLLADLGADVVKVEEPGAGDFYRARRRGATTDSPRWQALNFNKRSVAIDLKRPESRPLLEQLIRAADVVVHNVRPQVADRLGISYDEVHRINPNAIYASLTGYGDTGPLRNRRGGDPYALAISGAVSVQGSPGGPPYLGGAAWVDHSGAAVAAFGIVSALFQRERTGSGQGVFTNLLNVALFGQTGGGLADYLCGGPMPYKGGRGFGGGFPWGAYKASDGDVVVFLGASNVEWPRLCKAIGVPELAEDPRFDTEEKRRAAKEELYVILDERFSTATRAEWAERFRKVDLRADPSLTYAEMLGEPQVTENKMIITCPPSNGETVTAVGHPLSFTAATASVRSAPPEIGEHTGTALHDWGVADEDVDRLTREGVLA